MHGLASNAHDQITNDVVKLDYTFPKWTQRSARAPGEEPGEQSGSANGGGNGLPPQDGLNDRGESNRRGL